MTRKLAASFVAAMPKGTSTETRLRLTQDEQELMWMLYDAGGRLRNRDLRFLVELKVLDDGDEEERKNVLAARRRNLTGDYSGRFASAVCKANVEEWQLGKRNLIAHRKTLRRKIAAIEKRLKVGVGNSKKVRGRKNKVVKGYRTKKEAWGKRNRLNHLKQKLEKTEAAIVENRVKVCRGGAALARKRHNLEAASLTVGEWKHQWRVQRGWFAAVGSSNEHFGNDTINVDPHTSLVEIMLPEELADLSNTPTRRRTIRFESPVSFEHLGDEWRVLAEAGFALRYEIVYKHTRRSKDGGWYLKVSWGTDPPKRPSLTELRQHRTLAVDFNADHFACWVIEADGNPVGKAITVPLDIENLSSTETDAYTCQRILDLAEIAQQHDCRSVTAEDLGFDDARDEGREWQDSSKQFRHTVSGMPTSKVKQRLVSMLHNLNDPIWVIVVDPAYTSVLGKSHWLTILKESYDNTCTSHHAAAVVIGRRGLGLTARRRLSIHESEQKSLRECFPRSIRHRGQRNELAGNPGGQTNEQSRTQDATEPTETPEDATHPVDASNQATKVQGEDKQFDLTATSQHGTNTHV